MKAYGANAGRLYPLRRGNGLAANRTVREGLLEALQFQVLVPLGSKVFVLLVHVEKDKVAAAHNRPGTSLDAHIVVTPVLCETPDYVEWGERMQSKRGLSSFRLHIVRVMRGRSSGGRQAGSV